MAQLRLPKLPDRTPVKIGIALPPELHSRLEDYAAAYAAAYGEREPLAELIPAMLAAYLESDRLFARRNKAGS